VKYFPLTVIDNFFPDLEYVLELSRKIEYLDLGPTPFPGKISKDLQCVDKYLYEWVVKKILNTFWDTLSSRVTVQAQVDFQKIEPSTKFNDGLIHHEIDPKCAAIVYLNESPVYNSGTSFYQLKKEYRYYNEECPEYDEYVKETTSFHGGKQSPNYEKVVEDHKEKYEEVIRIQPKQNRMILYSPEMWHSQTNYGDETRYTMRCFIHSVCVKHENREIMCPMLR